MPHAEHMDPVPTGVKNDPSASSSSTDLSKLNSRAPAHRRPNGMGKRVLLVHDDARDVVNFPARGRVIFLGGQIRVGR